MLYPQPCSVRWVPHVQVPVEKPRGQSYHLWDYGTSLCGWTPLNATTGRATEAQVALNSYCQKGWYGDGSCQGQDQRGCRKELRATAAHRKVLRGTWCYSLPQWVFSSDPPTPNPQLPAHTNTNRNTRTSTFKPVLCFHEYPKPNSQIKMHSITSGLLTCYC